MAIKVKIFEFNIFGENTYVVFDDETRQTAVIDPGMMNEGECELFGRFVDENKLNIKYLINTHLHVDHVAGDQYVERTFGVPLSASPLDEFLADRVAEQAKMFHLNVNVSETVTIGNPLNNGDKLMLGKYPIEVISVPGHSPGSIALNFPENGFVITGDALFRQSIGRTDLPGGNFNRLIESIRTRLLTLPATTVVFPGHGSRTTVEDELRTNPFVK